MKTVEVSKEEIINFKRLNLISEIQSLKKALELFEKKYNPTFKEFENGVFEEKEDFDKWDDYLEWKAYLNTYKDIETACGVRQ